ncbi:MAG: TrkA family potassium uptake protein [Smithellaceae bacterium]|jgi:trk system potassium uptake protein TrkA|nr:TrkA family potassium uptake protein [Smithellaceae bacterium]MDD3260016.1 TrkA family potassium uptake protein [Smithellaceae bacterium]MDD3848451.1 TrkA family potassium uptake protein [Smithellaceae bacterium]HOG12790.1 TrkA family potassium uptake protein [Smithellaceae bacterium]HOQ71250.1 TrkA family potassium uptake protein [Smithellaceae bacterium]
MRYIVIGLGFFGSSLAAKLTSLGHEVIGIDRRSERAEELKDKITNVMIMDCTKPAALSALPLSDVDAVIVAVGEDIGSSVLILSMLKKQKVKRIIGRAINPMHQNILGELGIEEIIHPEEDTATELTAMLMVQNAVNTMIVNDKIIIAELKVPDAYVGHTLEAANLENRFGIRLVAVKIAPAQKSLSTLLGKEYEVDLSGDPHRPLGAKDRLIVIGRLNDIRRFVD